MRRVVGWREYVLVTLIGLFVLFSGSRSVQAGALTGMRDYLLRQQASLTSGQTHQVFFIPATSLPGSGNTLELAFPIGQSSRWCRTAGSDATVTGITDPIGATEGATALPGTLTASCSQGDNSTTGDQLVVSGVGPLVSGTRYGVSIADGSTTKLGTPPAANNILVNVKTTNGISDVDAGIFWLATVSNDHVVISATVSSAPEPTTNPVVQFIGRASPGTDVHIHRDTITDPPLQSVPTDPAAKFNVTLTDQPTGQHTYTIEANDTDGRPHTALVFALNLSAGSTTVISGVFLGPTIAVDKTTATLGENVTVFGKTAPSSTVTVTVSSDPVSYNLTADANGDWSKSVKTTDIGTGSHEAVARAVSTDNSVSENSPTATFAVNPLDQCDGKQTADINCDGDVNLTDFSIMLYFWKTDNPANARADINGDGTVSIVDFSIMLYQWTG